MTDDDDLLADVQSRADQDPDLLSRLTPEERAGYIVGRAERAWLRIGLFLLGAAVGVCTVVLSGSAR